MIYDYLCQFLIQAFLPYQPPLQGWQNRRFVEIASIVINSTLITQGRIVVKKKNHETAKKKQKNLAPSLKIHRQVISSPLSCSLLLVDIQLLCMQLQSETNHLKRAKASRDFYCDECYTIVLSSELYVVYFTFPLQLKGKVIPPVSDITGLFYYVPQA